MSDTVLDSSGYPLPPNSGVPLAAAWGRTVVDEQCLSQNKVFAAFRVVDGPGTGRLIDLKATGDTRLGRDASLNDILLNDAKASAQHLIVRADGEEFGVIDLGSVNGTFINGEKVLAPVVLRSEDRVSVGDITMVFHLARSSVSI